jgi:hypothetical protein
VRQGETRNAYRILTEKKNLGKYLLQKPSTLESNIRNESTQAGCNVQGSGSGLGKILCFDITTAKILHDNKTLFSSATKNVTPYYCSTSGNKPFEIQPMYRVRHLTLPILKVG